MNIYDKVITPNIVFKNRVVMPPMATAKADESGHITDKIIKYYDEKTKSRLFSVVIVEHSYIDIKGKAHRNQMSVSTDSDIEGLKKVSDVIKRNGSLAILQISHSGSLAKKEFTGFDCVAPSAIKNPTGKGRGIPKELSIEEIKDIERKFVDSAIRAKDSGFDGVEIHSAHGYLLNQFLSPLSNKRKDEYGGDIYGRIKIHTNIINGIRKSLGLEYPLFIRMGAGDFIDGGLSVEDSVIAAKEFEKLGVDVIDISGGMCFYTIPDTYPGYFDTLSSPIFKGVNIPVILTGRVTKGSDIEDILSRNVCDLVGVGRAVFNDSGWMDREVEPLFKK
ncbi:MAG: NADH oxidase [Candidatus Cloacimonadota bacterium]|nr:MAG: NADH oxidase [Candidatus Cloacimonadota bacterium]PIE78054.1 MAG: NADH oxidase [Candidatus Delongbacteria bacterium]